MALMNCAECGKLVSDLASCCPHCGAPVEKKVYCKDCGEQIAESVNVCPNCGCPRTQPNTPPPFGQNTNPQPPVSTTPGVFDEGSCGKSRGVAALLAFFLGGFGAQYFYIGKSGAGALVLVLNILFCWTVIVPAVFGILFLIQTIMFFTMSHEQFEEKVVNSTSFMPLW